MLDKSKVHENVKKYVYILTWCNKAENLYGTTLIFKTLRVGFPNTEIHVTDNASLPNVRPLIQQLAKECNAKFVQLENEISHYSFIEQTLSEQSEGIAIFVDPDICFWKNVERWNFTELLAGRLLPKFICEYTGCLTHPRLHTSFLWIPDVAHLQMAINEVKSRYFSFQPFQPSMFKLNSTWQRFDTGSSLYLALQEQTYAFNAKELEAYDHLFCGTHLQAVASKIRPDYALLFERMHKHVQVDHRVLKGAWKLQEEYFQSLAL